MSSTANADAYLHDFPSLFSLAGKVAIVTGGSRGLGLSSASALLQAGASKVFISSRKAQACISACATLNALPNLAPGAVAIPIPADLSTLAGVRHLVAEVSKHTARVDVLCANAGATWGAPLAKHGDEAFAKVMDLNVRGVFNLVRECLPLLERGAGEDPGRVIITASVAGLGAGPEGTYGYVASKAAVVHLGRQLGVELGPKGVRVNSVCPGFFPSRMSRGLLEASEGGVEGMGKRNPAGRLGRPEDMAGVVVFLASRAGQHVNGAALVVDGGAMWTGGELRGGEAKL